MEIIEKIINEANDERDLLEFKIYNLIVNKKKYDLVMKEFVLINKKYISHNNGWSLSEHIKYVNKLKLQLKNLKIKNIKLLT